MPLFRLFRIRSKYFILVITLCAVALFSTVGFVAYTQLYKQRRFLSAQMSHNLSSQVSTAMTLWLEDKVELAHSMAQIPDIISFCKNPHDTGLRIRLEKYFADTHRNYLPHLTLLTIMYFSPDKRPITLEINGLDQSIEYGASVLDSIGGRSIGVGDMSFSYIKAIAEGGTAFISEAKPNAVPGLPPLFMVAVPVIDWQGRTIGAFGFGVQLNHFSDNFIANFQHGKTGRLEIVDDRGFYIGHVKKDRILSEATVSEIGDLISRLDPQAAVSFDLQTADGVNRHYASTPVIPPCPSANNWWVLFNRTDAELHRELRPHLFALIIVCTLGAAFMIGLGFNTRSSMRREVDGELIRQDAERKKLYMDNAPYGVLLLSPEGIIIDANLAASTIFGYMVEEIVNTHVSDFIPGCPLKTDERLSFEDIHEFIPAVSKQKEELYLAVSPRALADGFVLVFLRNTTQLVQQQRIANELSENLQLSFKESEQLRLDAERANRAKSQFLANMSHEIRTPMNAVLGMTHLLLETSLDQKQKNYADKVYTAARSLLGIINDILDFSKIEAGRMDLECIPMDMATILDNIHIFFSETAKDKGIALRLSVCDDIPPGLMGDPTRLGQILINLVGNAIKFTSHGSVDVSCRVVSREASTATLSLSVSDTGIGISHEKLERLFKAFTQADSSTTRQFGGTGLGLVISKRLVELMGGSIAVSSIVGQGSEFTIECPFLIVSRDEYDTGTDSAQGIDPENAMEMVRGISVLLVEDNEVNQEIAVEVLTKAGARVEVAENGREAVTLIEAILHQHPDEPLPFDVILMDLQMPVMDGYTATRKLRDLGVTVPIIAMTAHALVEERDRCIQAGMDDHVSKPFEVRDLFLTLARWLDREDFLLS